MSAPEKLLTAAGVADWLQCPRMSVYALHRERGLPAIRLGRALRFSRPAVQAWLDAGGTAGTNGGGDE